MTVSGGVAQFSGLFDDLAEQITLNFDSDTGLTTQTTNPIKIIPGDPWQLVVQTPPPSAAAAGVPFTTTPVVYEEDQYGNLETTDSGTLITVLLASGSGPLQGPTTVMVSGGVAEFSGLSDDRLETIALAFKVGILLTPPTNPIVVGPGPAAKLVVQAQPSATATAGLPFATQPVIVEEDQFGNLETGDNKTVITASPAGGAGSLQGPTTATVKGGVATFTGLAEDTAGALTLRFTVGSLSTSSAVTVSAAPATHLVVTTPPPSPLAVGQPFTMAVSAEDPYGNVDTSYNGAVMISLPGQTGAPVGAGAGRRRDVHRAHR